MTEFRFLTIDQICKMLDKKKSWVYDHAHDLGGIKIGGSWFFTEDNFRLAMATLKDQQERRRDSKLPRVIKTKAYTGKKFVDFG